MPNGQPISAHMANSGAQAGPSPMSQGQQMQPLQDQQAHAAHMMQAMYNYPQMSNYSMGLPPNFVWSMDRVVPANTQYQMPGIAPNSGHPQQMLNVGKGGMQGR